MESNNKKTSKKPKLVKKPYLTGKPTDPSTIKNALAIVGMLVVMMILFLLLGAIFMFDNVGLRLVLNGLVLGTCYLMFFYYGVSSGTQAVNHGEIMHNRRETGREVLPQELNRCYHPLKGLIASLIGSTPLVICGVILALTAQRQMVGIGTLPSWVSGLTNRSEIGDAVAFYSEVAPLGAEGVTRLICRMSLMPWVNIFDANNSYAMLTMERISPILLLLPAIFYGIGYTRGPVNRARVHGDIAASKRKRARKNRQQKKGITAKPKAPKAPKGPEQLN